MTCGFLIQLILCEKKQKLWFIGVALEQETGAAPPKKNPGSAPERCNPGVILLIIISLKIQVR